MKRFIKKLSRMEVVHRLISAVAVGYMRLVLCTSRCHYHIPTETRVYLEGKQPLLWAAWHNRILLMPSLSRTPLAMYALVSKHSDGRLIGRVLHGFGVKVVYGSTSHGGAHAMRQLITIYENGHHIALTPDGPRGPNEVVSVGVAQLAMLTNAPIICISYAAKRAIRLRSWDKFMIPLPCNVIHFVYAPPVIPSAYAQADKKQQRALLQRAIQTALDNATHQAERHFGTCL